MRVARPVVLSPEQREMLESRARARSASARSVERARIVLMAGAGLQDKQIAAKLSISCSTVQVHRKNISRKLDIHKQTDLVRYAIREGLSKP